MQRFSEDVKGKEPATQRRLFTLFQRAVKSGELPALKLLTRFEIQGVKGTRNVHDYAYTDDTAKLVAIWIDKHLATRGLQGIKVEDLSGMSDKQLATLIKGQRKPVQIRTTKRKAATATADEVNNAE